MRAMRPIQRPVRRRFDSSRARFGSLRSVGIAMTRNGQVTIYEWPIWDAFALHDLRCW